MSSGITLMDFSTFCPDPYREHMKPNPLLPKKYKDRHGNIKSFKKIKYDSWELFNTLFHFISPEASVQDKTPTLLKYICKEVTLKFLNYTNIKVSLNNKRHLYFDDVHIISFNSTNSHHILYHVPDYPAIVCWERKSDMSDIPDKRLLMRKGTYKLYLGITFGNFIKNPYSQIPFIISDPKEYLKKDASLKILTELIPLEADLIPNPTIIQFLRRLNTCRLTLLNHTKHEIEMDIFRQLFIDKSYIGTLNSINDCRIIAYHIQNERSIICFEKMDGINPPERFYHRLVFKEVKKQECEFALQNVHKKWAFERIWKTLYGPNSFFFHNIFPKDVVGLIIKIFLDLYKNSFKNNE